MKEQTGRHLSTLIRKKSSRKIQARQEPVDGKRSWEILSFHLSTLFSFVLASLAARPLQRWLPRAPSTHPFTVKANRPKSTFPSHSGESLRPGSRAYSCSWHCTWTRSTGRAGEKPEKGERMLFQQNGSSHCPCWPTKFSFPIQGLPPPSLLLHYVVVMELKRAQIGGSRLYMAGLEELSCELFKSQLKKKVSLGNRCHVPCCLSSVQQFGRMRKVDSPFPASLTFIYPKTPGN